MPTWALGSPVWASLSCSSLLLWSRDPPATLLPSWLQVGHREGWLARLRPRPRWALGGSRLCGLISWRRRGPPLAGHENVAPSVIRSWSSCAVA